MQARQHKASLMSKAYATRPDAAVLLREDNEGVATLILNRSAARNALSTALIEALAAVLAAIRDDRGVRAVVIAANGPAFCAGHDLKEITAARAGPDHGRAFFHHAFSACAEMMQAIVHLPQPVIACVQGIATAAGCQLAASCDLVVASEAARFATPGVDIGFFCATPMVAVSRKVPPGPLMEMLLTGEPIAAARAREIGLVNRVTAAGKERHEALALARVIASKSAYVQKVGKAAFYRQLELGLADAYDYTIEIAVENMLARDAAEGIGAFLDMRTPKWEDR
jgi:enoyl-CoA hydratase/carnithine racemase